jgi:hypothetical protein
VKNGGKLHIAGMAKVPTAVGLRTVLGAVMVDGMRRCREKAKDGLERECRGWTCRWSHQCKVQVTMTRADMHTMSVARGRFTRPATEVISAVRKCFNQISSLSLIFLSRSTVNGRRSFVHNCHYTYHQSETP